jgi:NAD(P)-dependent dehydrogenase (short-subunit alcohol dehydrogenase family)
LDLAQRGASVIMACRDLPRSQIVCEQIRRQTKNSNVFVEYLDLESFESVKTFTNKILNEYKSIDILVNNAGVMGCPYGKTVDGFEKHFQVNYLSHYLLTRLLMNRIKSSPNSRIINLTSKLYESIDF